MPLLDWNSGNFSLSIKEIDDQHKKWIDMMNNLHFALLNNKGNEMIEETIADLVDYTITHFALEEALMKKMNYPGFRNHRIQHEALKEEVSQLQKDYISNECILSSQVMSRLKNWLTGHILTEDKKYADFYHKKDLRQ